MNRPFLITLLLFNSLFVFSQQKDLTDSTQFRYGLPVSNDDTVKQVRSDQDPRNEWTRVEPKKLPHKLQRTLSDKAVYAGWEQSELYYDRRAQVYLVRIRDNQSVRTYGFSKDGKPVSFTDEDLPQD